MEKNELTFALDIGTRSVVGLILKEENDFYHIVDTVIKEHDKRSMLDGQIHDVLSVATVIASIKQELEVIHGPLRKVCVAAAGRALKTERALVSIDITGKPMIQKEDILHLELMAVQSAQKQIAKKGDGERAHHYDCVGYSILRYQLDGEDMGNLIDQQGDEASVEIIATFLPKVVVESLLAALSRADLEMEALTLEPIAAINVLIPQSMRRLNVVLVDIGAGTSDIAITDMGTIISYGMVPIAGDEITEAVSDAFLLDFPQAEEAKRTITTNSSITVTDILGFETEVTKEEATTQISHAIDKLAEAIKNEILQLNNGKSPKAVMLVGGGSLTPELPQRLATMLGLPDNRVAIRGIDAIAQLKLADHIHRGPELVTPIGIAVASKLNPIQYISVKVNERTVRLFHMKSLTVGDSLLASGLQLNKLFGKPGMALMIEVNGQSLTIPGEHGTPPTIKKNDQICSLEEGINHGDIIVVEKGEDGKTATIPISAILDVVPPITALINGETYTVQPSVYINGGSEANFERILTDRDKVTYDIPSTISEFLAKVNMSHLLAGVKPFSVELNNHVLPLSEFSGKLFKNGLLTTPEAKVENGDILVLQLTKEPSLYEFVTEANLSLSQTLPITFNGKSILLEKSITDFYRNGIILSSEKILHNGDKLISKKKPIDPFIFQDIFTVIDINLPASGSKQFILLNNGQETTFQDPLSPGDELSINWL